MAINQGSPVGRRRTIIRSLSARESSPTGRHPFDPCGHPPAAWNTADTSRPSWTLAKADGVWLGPRSRPTFPAAAAASRAIWTRPSVFMVKLT